MTTKPIKVIRTYSLGVHRFEYALCQDGISLSRVYTDEESRYAVINLESMSLSLRRDASELSKAEIEDPATYIAPVIINT